MGRIDIVENRFIGMKSRGECLSPPVCARRPPETTSVLLAHCSEGPGRDLDLEVRLSHVWSGIAGFDGKAGSCRGGAWWAPRGLMPVLGQEWYLAHLWVLLLR